MAQRYYPFDSNNGDRLYTASDVARERELLYSDGIILGGGAVLTTELKVSAVSGLRASVGYGAIMIKGRTFENINNGQGTIELTFNEAHLTLPRIDRVIARLDLNDASRKISIEILTGTPSATPSAPTLTRNSVIWELSLAQVRINGNTSSISTITDERGDVTLCGICNVTVGIIPPTNNLASTVTVSDATALLYGHANTTLDKLTVDEGLGIAIGGNSSYLAFASNTNWKSVETAFGRLNEEYIFGIGRQLAMLGYYLGVSKSELFPNLKQCQTLNDISANANAFAEIKAQTGLYAFLRSCPYAFFNALSLKKFNLCKDGLWNFASFVQSISSATTASITQMADGSVRLYALRNSGIATAKVTTPTFNTGSNNKVIIYGYAYTGGVLSGSDHLKYFLNNVEVDYYGTTSTELEPCIIEIPVTQNTNITVGLQAYSYSSTRTIDFRLCGIALINE